MSIKDRRELKQQLFEEKRDGMGPEERQLYALEDIADSLNEIRKILKAPKA